MWRQVIDATNRARFPHTTRWFLTCAKQTAFASVLGEVTLLAASAAAAASGKASKQAAAKNAGKQAAASSTAAAGGTALPTGMSCCAACAGVKATQLLILGSVTTACAKRTGASATVEHM
jgi:hypothetical protein